MIANTTIRAIMLVKVRGLKVIIFRNHPPIASPSISVLDPTVSCGLTLRYSVDMSIMSTHPSPPATPKAM